MCVKLAVGIMAWLADGTIAWLSPRLYPAIPPGTASPLGCHLHHKSTGELAGDRRSGVGIIAEVRGREDRVTEGPRFGQTPTASAPSAAHSSALYGSTATATYPV